MNFLAGVLLWVLLVVFTACLWALPTMLLWDWLVPTLFGLKTITLFQAWGINVLCGLLFKTSASTTNKD